MPQLAGREAYVTLSAVDVGILNITRFPVPDAAGHFFAQRRLGVDAYDIYGRVVESFEGSIAKIRFGGDMALAALPQARRPTAKVQTPSSKRSGSPKRCSLPSIWLASAAPSPWWAFFCKPTFRFRWAPPS